MTPPPEPLARYVLWYRDSRTRSARWLAVAAGDSERELLAEIARSGRRHGDWMTLPTGVRPDGKAGGRRPNTRVAPPATPETSP